ncbi:MAG TPA: PQQ-binding-like beta-propeller repeat protein [Sandaracinaceae bacterium]
MKRAVWPLASIAAIALAALPAAAHPVRIGRYAEIPYGIRPDHPYPTASGGPRRTGRQDAVAPAREPQRVWERTLRHRRLRGPAIAADGTLYFGTNDGLTAVGPDGVERWSVRLGTVPATPSLVPSDDVVVVTRGGLVAVVTRDGTVRHTADLGAPARGSPLVLDDGSILAATIDRRVHRLDASLRRVFSVEVADSAGTTLSRTTRGLIAVPGGRTLALLEPTGRIVREVALAQRTSSSAAVADDGTLWLPTPEGLLLAIDASGRVRSRTELGGRYYDGAAIAVGRDGAVRVPTLDRGVVCVGPGGTERWRHTAGQGYNAPATVDREDTTLVVDRVGQMFAIARDGTERWRVHIEPYTLQAPVLGADGTIYVATEAGTLQAWRDTATSGSEPP